LAAAQRLGYEMSHRTLLMTITAGGLFASFAAAQPAEGVERALRFSHTKSSPGFQEIATVIRSITDMRLVTVDSGAPMVAVRGTPEQIALAEWLFRELDKPAPTPLRHTATPEYRLPSGTENVVRLFYVAHAATPHSLQEMATLVRSIADIRRVFTNNAASAIVMRGTADQIALAGWLLDELDKAPDAERRYQHSAAYEYREPGSAADSVRVFYLKPEVTVQNLQEAAVMVRTTTQVRRLFTYNATRAITLRGTADQVAMAERLIAQR
jgi:hypothetical protein